MSLIKHSALNLAGNFIPALVSLPAYGYLARVLGVELFGIYTLAIIVIGYAGIFDAGLTRAVIREIALYREDKIEQRKIIACSTISIIIFGFIAMFTMAGSAPLIVDILNITSVNKADAISAISLLALSIPIFLLNQIWLSILEGNELFFQLNIQRSMGSIFFAGMPVLLITFEQNILSAVMGLFIARLIMLAISAFMVRNEIISAGLKFDKVVFKRLINFGGWSALTGIISPVMVYFDRFILANMIGAKFVAIYSAPAELISKGLLVPSALARSIFPKLAVAKNENEKNELTKLGYKLIFAVCGSGTLLGLFLAEIVMITWMGDNFAGEPVLVLRILLIGFFFNSLAQIPYASIQANGKSKITALIHLFEMIPYLVILVILIKFFGVVGAALAWSIRVTVDFFLLFLLSKS
ncbi:flippase [Aeromonas veronii]